mmetsp:Transcript_32713/g.71367  ORF Transcript_32713/g.71367 Transcript_32713/m.71367 type:complete len:215 (-) Transcript_32713:778-1422(-)
MPGRCCPAAQWGAGEEARPERRGGRSFTSGRVALSSAATTTLLNATIGTERPQHLAVTCHIHRALPHRVDGVQARTSSYEELHDGHVSASACQVQRRSSSGARLVRRRRSLQERLHSGRCVRLLHSGPCNRTDKPVLEAPLNSEEQWRAAICCAGIGIGTALEQSSHRLGVGESRCAHKGGPLGTIAAVRLCGCREEASHCRRVALIRRHDQRR